MEVGPCHLWSDTTNRGLPGSSVIPLRQVLGIACSSLSIVGCLYIIVAYRIRQAKKVYVDSVGRLVHVLAWLDFVGCISRILLEALKPTFPTQLLDLANPSNSPDWNDPTWNKECKAWKARTGQILCALLHFSIMGSICWHCIISYNLYRWICKGDDQRILHQRFIVYFWWMVSFAFVMSVVPFIQHAYDTNSYAMRTDEVGYAVGCHYLWLISGWFLMITFLVRVQYDMRKRLGHHPGLANWNAITAYNEVGRKLILFVCAYLIFRISDIAGWSINSSELTGDSFFIPLLICNNVLAPLTGFVNAMIYGGITFHGIYRQCCCERKTTLTLHGAEAGENNGLNINPSNRPSIAYQQAMGRALIFASSFDLNYASFSREAIPSWLPVEQQDLYVLGFINCCDANEAQASVLAHLNARFAPLTQYKAFATFSRKAIHSIDHPIVQIVFARTIDVASGNISIDIDRQMKSTSKYITGMSLRYFDMSIAFATCSLKPIAGNYTVHQKLLEISSLLQSFSPDVDSPGLDFHHQFHHTILMGNLNFGMNMRQDINERIKEAHLAQMKRMNTNSAIDKFFFQNSVFPRQSYPSFISVDNDYITTLERRQSEVAFGLVQSPGHSDSANPSRNSSSFRLSFESFLRNNLIGSWTKPSNNRNEQAAHKLIQDAQSADEVARMKWDDLVKFDILRTLMDNNDGFFGFEEPVIEFLPTFPRVLELTDVYDKNVLSEALFTGNPIYSDRILYHSLSGVQSRFVALSYYVCEAIAISPHKPICAQFQLEVNRMHPLLLQQSLAIDSVLGQRQLLKEKTNVKHYGFELSNLDANLWEPTEPFRLHSMRTSSASTLVQHRSSSSFPVKSTRKLENSCENHNTHPMQQSFSSMRRLNSWKNFLSTDLKKVDYSDEEETIVQAVEPERISIVFPLPSVDNFRFQRKIYELAQSVTQAYDVKLDATIKAHDDYTNCTESSWSEAVQKGIVHTSVVRSTGYDSILHLIVKVEGPHSTGGEGVIAIPAKDIGRHHQFDIPLSWGGKHTGYLHVDLDSYKVNDQHGN
ncbi:hypothetical protein THRCLA_04752 [Thraustotheca clavata]|uniref:Inositol polyphosphate-related phosphatase domain-containing protein n=1 Tax=Thraustotheca clavata TaxID=74557 RepID=A0A1V9ZY24_9STRA|nr:hypothetical protein THRCLA_04752 [Thraustotheca clavata]